MTNMISPIIWIIDDDLVAQFNAEIRIRQAGICGNVTRFDTAHAALVELMDPEIPQMGRPNIIILNLYMPEIAGWEFLTQLSAIVHESAYPDIFLTSSNMVSTDIIKAKEHQMIKGYFVKPLTPQNMELILKGEKNLKEV